MKNNKTLYYDIMLKVSKVIKEELNEGLRHNVGNVTMLKKPVQLSNIELIEPIFISPIHSLWYRNFVLKGGSAFVEKIHGMDSHTFVCNTHESVKMLNKWLKKYMPDYLINEF